MHHYLYKITIDNGKFYIGRHSTKNLDDNYMGSGKWVRSIKDKNRLRKEILSFYEDIETLKNAEEITILEYIQDENNMNFNTNSCGFSYGDLNPSKSEIARKLNSERVSGNNNPTKSKEVAEKISRSLKKWYSKNKGTFTGKTHTQEAKEKMKVAAEGRQISESTRDKLKELNRTRMLDGRNPTFNRKGAFHSEESKKKMSDSQKLRPKKECDHCGKVVSVNTYARWHGDNCAKRTQETS